MVALTLGIAYLDYRAARVSASTTSRPGMIPGFPPPVAGISYNFRCEAVTECQVGTVDLEKFIEISLGGGTLWTVDGRNSAFNLMLVISTG
jgi:hypothetical protein